MDFLCFKLIDSEIFSRNSANFAIIGRSLRIVHAANTIGTEHASVDAFIYYPGFFSIQ